VDEFLWLHTSASAYLIEYVISIVKGGGRDLMSEVPAGLTNGLLFRAGSNNSIPMWGGSSDDRVNVWTKCLLEISADALALSWGFRGGSTTIGNHWGTL
jgi:hypothetical protein